ncbi:MAG: Gfo/Idh/MocA family protein [Planctomycetota bacterium]
MQAVRVALFGNGFARTVMLPCLRLVDGVKLVGIASPNLKRAEATAAEFGIERVAIDHQQLLEAARPDLVFVATPPHRHCEQALAALRAGAHVVCEKPTALNARESAQLVAAARRYPQQLALIDHELRVDPRRVRMRALVRSGALGRVLHASYTLTSSAMRDPDRSWSWWNDASQGGGALGAIGSHAVDALRELLGEVREVRGLLETVHRERADAATGERRPASSDDVAAAWLRFDNDVLASLHISTVESSRVHRFQVACARGAVRLDEGQPLTVWTGKDEARTESVTDDLPSSATLGIPETDWARNFLRFARTLVRSIQTGAHDGVAAAATFADGHRIQCVLDAIRRSNETSEWVACGASEQ